MKCKKCGTTLQFDFTNNEFYCPKCGLVDEEVSENYILDSGFNFNKKIKYVVLSTVLNDIEYKINKFINKNNINVVDKNLFYKNLILFSNFLIKNHKHFEKVALIYFLLAQNAIGIFGKNILETILKFSNNYLGRDNNRLIRKYIRNNKNFKEFLKIYFPSYHLSSLLYYPPFQSKQSKESKESKASSN
ncbi:MAG: TFIIB-type zinc ribbon-containing protein [Candidatus Aenigmatarchaeota archaeon]